MSANITLQALHEIGTNEQAFTTTKDSPQEALDILENGMGYELLAILVNYGPKKGMKPLALSKQGQGVEFLKIDKTYVESKISNSVKGITNWVASSRQTVRIGNVANDPRYYGIRDGIRSELCAPLMIGKDVIGVINCETTRLNAYKASDEKFIKQAASVIMPMVNYHRMTNFIWGAGHVDIAETPAYVTVCAWCKNLKGANDIWTSPQKFSSPQHDGRLTHGICPECKKQLTKK